jgi:hypothetical protein
MNGAVPAGNVRTRCPTLPGSEPGRRHCQMAVPAQCADVAQATMMAAKVAHFQLHQVRAAFQFQKDGYPAHLQKAQKSLLKVLRVLWVGSFAEFFALSRARYLLIATLSD